MEVAAVRPDGLRDLADERDDVVVGGRARSRRCAPDRRVARSSIAASASGGTSPRAAWARADGDLDAEHLLEPRPLGPDGAHLRRACSGGSRERLRRGTLRGGAAPMSRRRCMPCHEIASAARSAARARRGEVAPAPDDREDPPAVGRPGAVGSDASRRGTPARRAASAAVEARDRIAAPGLRRIAGGREHDPDGRAGHRRERGRERARSEPRAPRPAAGARAAPRAAAGSPASRGRRTAHCTRAGAGRRR